MPNRKMESGIVLSCLVLCLLLQSSKQSVQQYCQTRSATYVGPELPDIADFTGLVDIKGTSNMSPTWGNFSVEVYLQEWKTVVTTSGPEQDKYDYSFDDGRHTRIRGYNCNITRSLSNPFGFTKLKTNPLKFSDLLHFGEKYSLVFKGYTTRGSKHEICKHWQGCVNEDGVSIQTDYFFSNASGLIVSYEAKGYALVDGHTSNVSRNYSFSGLRPPPLRKDLSYVTKDVRCVDLTLDSTLGLSKECSFPKIPNEFEMNIELQMSGIFQKSVFNLREYYDANEKYLRSDHHHNNSNGVRVPVHEIHDYNTGIAYLIDSTTLKCSINPIKNTSWDSLKTDDHHHIRMKSAMEFFGWSANKYYCNGTATVRGIPTDVIVSKQIGSRRDPNETMIRKWYFSRPGWKMSGTEGPFASIVPLRTIIYHTNRTTRMEFFNFDTAEPNTHILWMLRYCYVNNRHYMYFRIDSSYDKYGVTDKRNVISGLRDAVANAAGVSTLRVSSILIFKSGYGGVIAARLYVLGIPAVKGSVQILHPKHTLPLKDAVSKIRTEITTGKMDVKVKLNGKSSSIVTLKVQSKSYYDEFVDGPDPVPSLKPSSNRSKHPRAGVSGGAVVGIALGLCLLAVVITILAVHFMLKRRGVELFNYSRYNNEATA